MAIVYSYPLYKPEGGDLLLGSKIIEGSENSLPKNLTVNYSVATLTNYIIEQYAKGIAWEFVVSENEEDERPDGSLSFELYNANVPFQDITTIKISESASGGKYALQYLQALVDNNISISNYLDINNFGVYKLNSLVQDPLEPTFYNANLTFVRGNGNLVNTKLYYIEASAIGVQASLTNPVTGTGTLNFVSKFTSTGSTLGNSLIYDNGTNVGIGTTSPSEKLHVVGSVLIEGSSTKLKVKGSGGYDTANITMGNAAKADSFSIDTRNDPGDNKTTLSFDSYLTTGTSTITLGDNYVNLGTAGSTRLVINSSGNVGIGMTSPSQKLHVSGNARVTGAYYDSNNSAGTSGQVLSSTVTGTDWVSLSEISGVDGTGTANYVAKWSDADTITNSVIYDNGTNVGIGTTSPGAKLEVSQTTTDIGAIIGNTTHNSQLQIYTAAAAKNSEIWFGDAADADVGKIDYDHLDNSLNFTVNAAERMRITSSGNVGIGNTSPSNRLDVNGNMSAVLLKLGSPASGEGLLRYNPGSGNGIGITTGTLSSANIKLFVANNGNVGIGTTSPAARLEVKSAAPNTFFADFISSTGSGFAKIYENSNSHPLLYMADATGTTTIVLNSSGVSYLTSGNIIIGGTADNGDLLQVQGTGYFSGNVGIGTVNPSSKLDISGAVKIDTDGTYGSEYGMVGFGGTTDGYNRIFGRTTTADGLFLASATGRGIFFRANGGNTDHMVVTASGNVGIGTTSPQTKLEVAGVTTSLGFRTDVTNSNFNLISRDSSGNCPLFVQSANSSGNQQIARFSYGSATAGVGTDVLTVAKDNSYFTNTNVGIGTTSPSALLDIASGVGSTEFTGHQILMTRNGNNEIYAQGASSVLALGTNGSEDMRIDSSGNVGIGTTSPGAKLDVNGDALINGLTVGKGAGTSALGNTVFGKTALNNITTGSRNVAIGNEALLDNTTGNYNVAIGYRSLENNLANNNIAIGARTLERVETAGNNTAVGYLALSLTSGANNTAIGYAAGYNRVGGTNGNSIGSVFIGSLTYSNGINSTNEIVIGTNAISGGSNTVVLGNDSIVTTQLKGNVGIGTTAPTGRLHVYGGRLVLDNSANAQSAIQINSAGVEKIVIYRPTSTEDLRIYTPAAGDAFSLTQGGNVGIGTASPNVPLEVKGNVRITRGSPHQTTYQQIEIGDVSTIFNGQDPDGWMSYLFNSNNTTRLVINGNTGAIQFNSYSSTNQTGTPTYLLGTDASGNIVKTNTVPGSAAGPYLPLAGGTLTGGLVGTTGNFSGAVNALYFRTAAANSEYSLLTRDSTGNALFVQNAQSGTDQNIAIFQYGSAAVNQGTTVLQVAKDKSYFANCNVGIGTTSPGYKLSVNSSTLNEIANFESTDVGGFVSIKDNIDTSYFGSYNGKTFIGPAGGSSTTNLNIDNSNGNVGIGTTSPTRKLEVDFTGSVYGAKFTRSDATGSSLIEFANSAGVKSVIGYDAGVDGYKIGTASATNFVVKQSGNVGIGTTSPGAKLDIGGDVRTSTRYLITTGAANQSMAIGYWDGVNARVEAGSALPMLITSYQGNIKLGINGGTTMTIQSSNVGIGTTSPSAKLHVYSGLSGATVNANADDFIIESNTNAGISILGDGNETQYLMFGDASNSAIGRLTYNHVDDSMGLFTNATEKMRITSAGNVGIGTTTTDSKLNISGGSGDPSATYSTTAANSIIGIGNFSASGLRMMLGVNPNTPSTWIQNQYTTNQVTASLLLNPIGGNVGIGTTSPGAKLDVAGGVKIANDSSTAVATNVGTLRYRTSGNNSYVDMCMQTGAATYEWVNIVQNNW
jgi:hypothetical protein